MAMIACAECKKEISNKSAACPGCGAKVPKSKTWVWVLLALPVLFLGFGAIIGNSPDAKERAQARSAIELCWDEQGRKSNGAANAQFIAGACELMERRFKEKYGVNP